MPTPMHTQERKQFKVGMTLLTHSRIRLLIAPMLVVDGIRRRNDLRKLRQRHWQCAETVSRYTILSAQLELLLVLRGIL